MIKLDTTIQTQEERNEYIKGLDLSQCNNYELEKIADYILNGKAEEAKNCQSQDKLDKRIQKEQLDVAGDNLVDNEDFLNKRNTNATYKSKYDFTVTAKDAKNDPLIADYWELYQEISQKLKEKPDKYWGLYSYNKYSLMDDMKYIKSRHYFSAISPLRPENSTETNTDFSNIKQLAHFVRNQKPEVLKLGSDIMLDYLIYDELLANSNLTDEEKQTLDLIAQGFTSNEIADILNCRPSKARQGNNSYLSNALAKMANSYEGGAYCG